MTAEWKNCSTCDSRLDPAARFCDLCGVLVSSAGRATRRLGGQPGPWLRLGEYTVCVHDLIDGHVLDPAYRDTPVERTICVEVAYRNDTDAPLSYRLGQWMLYDTAGYAYEFEIRRYLYQGRDARKLQEGVLAPGRQARGWVAFIVPEDASVDYIQFRPGHLSDTTLEIAVG